MSGELASVMDQETLRLEALRLAIAAGAPHWAAVNVAEEYVFYVRYGDSVAAVQAQSLDPAQESKDG
jgi:hypothetical protein